MNFAFSEEQEEFRAHLRRFLEAESPTAEVFRLIETDRGFDPSVWKAMAASLGLQGIHIPERFGGQGFGFLELCIAFEEMGRALLCAPYFSSVCLAANAILNAGSDDDRQRWLPGIASGECVATLAVLEPNGSWDGAGVHMTFSRDGDTFTLDGRKALATDGAQADLVIVAAREAGTHDDEGLTLFAVRSDTPGFRATPVDALDPTRRLAHLDFESVPAAPLGTVGDAGPALRRTLDQACVCLAAESVGGAQRCLDSAVAYARERVQFGRAIGSFQAIKHKCAEVLLEVESAKATAYFAAWSAENDSELTLAAALAKSICDDAFRLAAAENIQIHGGIGFTWEHPAHLYFKRAKASELFLGDAAFHRERLAELAGI